MDALRRISASTIAREEREADIVALERDVHRALEDHDVRKKLHALAGRKPKLTPVAAADAIYAEIRDLAVPLRALAELTETMDGIEALKRRFPHDVAEKLDR